MYPPSSREVGPSYHGKAAPFPYKFPHTLKVIRAEVKVVRKVVKYQEVEVLKLLGEEGLHRKGNQALLLKRNIDNIGWCPQDDEGEKIDGRIVLEGHPHETVTQAGIA